MKKHLLTLICWTLIGSASAQFAPDLFSDMSYRNLGAFRIGAWVSDIAVPENPGTEHQYTWYVAQRAGGVWKTTNNGNTFTCISDDLGTSSIGCVEIAPSDPDILWIGTGEAYSARSSYAGNGIYKSTDAGETWTDMGLKDSHHINRIVIHPENPDIVYVAVMGHLFSDNEERGIFKSTNGGETWDKILYINESVGFIDLVMSKKFPDTLFAVSYDMSRSPWHFEAGGEKSRIYRTTDGGQNWSAVSGGLPEGVLGRIGIDIHQDNPDILYTVIQNLNPDPDYVPDPDQTFDEFTDNSYDALIGGQVFKSEDGGGSWRNVTPEGLDVSGKAAYSFNMIYADPTDPDKVYIIGVSMNYSLDGGKTWPTSWREKDRFRSNFGDVRCFWIDPEDPRHIKLGSDGGIYSSWDGGLHMHHYYHIPAGEIYHVEVDDARPYNIYIGLQDHETWKGPSNNWNGSIGLEDWVITGMWDGMYTQVDHENSRWIYFTTQFGKPHRGDQLLGKRTDISPVPPEGSPPYRYTWTTPLIISPHNAATLYLGAQCLLKSTDRGNTWTEISHDLTDNDPVKIAGKGHIMYCTITTISESANTPGLIWTGTDDGHVHWTADGGCNWTDVTGQLTAAGAPEELWVSRVAASNHASGRAYVTKSGYRNDLFEAFVFVTDDFGQSWKRITSGLPDAPVSVIYEDPDNEDLLYAGTDVGVFVSFDRGNQWISLQQNMPVVPVRDLLVHPREKDLVVGTYGRGAWIMDVSCFPELTDSVLNLDAHLFSVLPKPVQNQSDRAGWGNQQMKGDNHLRTPNEPNGWEVYYWLRDDYPDKIRIEVCDIANKILFSRPVKATKGLHKTYIQTGRLNPGQYRINLVLPDRIRHQIAVLEPAYTWPVGKLE